MAKKQFKGYYFSLKTEFKGRENGKSIFRFINGDDMRGILSNIRGTQLRDRFRDDYILALRGDSVRGDGVEIPEFEGYTSALFMRKRSTDLPRTAQEEGDGITVRRIEIGEDSFFMETTYVLIHNETATVLFLINGNVCNGSTPFVKYLKNFFSGDETRYLEMVPIVNIDRLRRLDSLDRILNIELSVRGALDAVEDENRTMSMGSILRTMNRVSNDPNANTIKITMSAKRNKGLRKDDVISFYDATMKNVDCSRKTNLFRVKGSGENGIETIDFINNEFLFTMTTDVSARNLDPADVLGLMHQHFISNLDYILQSMGSLE